MIIKCTNCGSRYRVSDDLVAAGPKRFKCKKCGTVLLIQPPSKKSAPAPAEQPEPSGPQAPEQAAAAVEEPPAPPEAADSEPPPEPPAETAAEPPVEQPPAEKQDEEAAETTEEEAAETTEEEAAETAEEEAASEAADDTADKSEETGESDEAGGGKKTELDPNLTPEEIAARQQAEIHEKLEKRRQQMEDEISGRLNKAALETLDFEILSKLAKQIQQIQENTDYIPAPDTKFFSCIKCEAIFCLYPDDSRFCANCIGEISLVRADDILKQYGMFG